MSTPGRGGRGAYYRNKYGGRGSNSPTENSDARSKRGGTYQDLRNTLHRIDGKQYTAYHDLETPENLGWIHPQYGFTLQIGRTQSDPFAPPTRCRILVPHDVSMLPENAYQNRNRRIAAADYILRQLNRCCRRLGADQYLSGSDWKGPKGGDIQVLEPTQHVLEQSAVQITKTGDLQAQITINLPARGRTILGRVAEQILDGTLCRLVNESFLAKSLDIPDFIAHIESVEDQIWLQSQLESRGLVAFVRNGAILPRESGVDDRPMKDNVIPFQSPPSLKVSFHLPNADIDIEGLGIPQGITIICGGGFHGKSTLLQALQVGVYPKVPLDGRDFVLTSPKAVKIRAEDGRCIQQVDISPFIKNLPFGKDTLSFSTADASGSTSQASNIVESIELCCDCLLVDEDTCATNFMIRDSKMMQLVSDSKEPITPFVRTVRSLHSELGISTILVIGGAGDYFSVADHVLLMDCYSCYDATERAHRIAADSDKTLNTPSPIGSFRTRFLDTSKVMTDGKVKVSSKGHVTYGRTNLDISSTEQIVTLSQTNAIASALQKLASSYHSPNQSLYHTLESLDRSIDQLGIDSLAPGKFHGGLTRPRIFEIGAALNRFRKDGLIYQLT